MNLRQLEALKNVDELELLDLIIKMCKENKVNTEKAIRGQIKANMVARKKMLDVKMLTDLIRDRLLGRNEKRTKKKHKDFLELVISKELIRLKKEDKRIERTEERRRRKNGEI